jgi:hypothetical protein
MCKKAISISPAPKAFSPDITRSVQFLLVGKPPHLDKPTDEPVFAFAGIGILLRIDSVGRQLIEDESFRVDQLNPHREQARAGVEQL